MSSRYSYRTTLTPLVTFSNYASTPLLDMWGIWYISSHPSTLLVILPFFGLFRSVSQSEEASAARNNNNISSSARCRSFVVLVRCSCTRALSREKQQVSGGVVVVYGIVYPKFELQVKIEHLKSKVLVLWEIQNFISDNHVNSNKNRSSQTETSAPHRTIIFALARFITYMNPQMRHRTEVNLVLNKHLFNYSRHVRIEKRTCPLEDYTLSEIPTDTFHALITVYMNPLAKSIRGVNLLLYKHLFRTNTNHEEESCCSPFCWNQIAHSEFWNADWSRTEKWRTNCPCWIIEVMFILLFTIEFAELLQETI
jgi:hypothetical protein